MAFTDRKAHQYSGFARRHLLFYTSSVPINQAAVLYGTVMPYQGFPTPPYALYGWQIDNVQVFTRAIAATAQLDVQIGSTSVLTGLVTPVAGSVVQGTLVATLLTRRGKFIDQISAKYTTNGTGTLTDVLVVVTIRPFPLDGEAA